MKGRVLVLDKSKDRGCAAALVVDGTVQDLLLDPPDGSSVVQPGAIWTTKITRKLPGQGGAFCALGDGDGYLREAKGLKSGDPVKVQVVSLPEPGKAPTVTTRLLLKGPRLILTPLAPGINVSRQIRDPDDAGRLKEIAGSALDAVRATAGLPETCGVIVRTVAAGEAEERLRAELNGLAHQYAALHAAEGVTGGGRSALRQALTEWLFPMPDQIACSTDLARELAKPQPPFGAMEFWGDERFPPLLEPQDDPFGAFDIDQTMAVLGGAEAALAAGSVFIEATRALVAVDVNTGGDFSPAAGLKANLAAARDLPRQLRLRGLGGQVVIDFAPMPKKDRRTLEEALRKAFRADPIETALVGWTSMGLFEIQRKRERRPLFGDLR